MMETYCSHCKEKTGAAFNMFMVEFCEKCKRMKGDPSDYYTPQAYICMHCDRGFEETYVGQRVCKDCTHGLSRGDWE